jgi:hypothetical protein
MKSVDAANLSADQLGEALAMAAIATVATADASRSRKDLAILAAKYKKMFKTNPKTEPGQVFQPSTKKFDDGDTLGYVQAGLSKK